MYKELLTMLQTVDVDNVYSIRKLRALLNKQEDKLMEERDREVQTPVPEQLVLFPV